jgi:pimeloyl-ACP methyl ester carboxylesterase
MTGYSDLPTLSVSGKNGVAYVYRDTGGPGGVMLLLQHFRGNLDSWDPALVDSLASKKRRVLTFDNVGVGASTGVTPSSIAEMAQGALAFIDALGLDRIEILGFSIGSFVAQEIMLTRPGLASRVVLASAAPQGADGMHGWSDDVMAGQRRQRPDDSAAVLPPAGRADPGLSAEDLSRRSARIPVPASRGIRR